jgi:hypothetical protein
LPGAGSSSNSPGRQGLGNTEGRPAGSVAALAAQVLAGRQQQRSHLSSLRSSLESANLLLLGSSAMQSPCRQQQQQGLGGCVLDNSRGAVMFLTSLGAWHVLCV